MSADPSAASKKTSEQEDKDAAYLKRREQVRRAQRTHRERKENYIKALEDELFNLRARQREVEKENQSLTSQVTHLRSVIEHHESQEHWLASDSWFGAAANTAVMESRYDDSLLGVGWQMAPVDMGSCYAGSVTSSEGYLGAGGSY